MLARAALDDALTMRALLLAVAALAPSALALSAILPRPSAAGARGAAPAPAPAGAPRHPGIAAHAEFDALRGEFDREKLLGFFATRPHLVVARLVEVATALRATRAMWDAQASLPEPSRDRGARLVNATAALGPVAVKLGQTLSQRPDIVGTEASLALRALQTSNVPFDDALARALSLIHI